ncbi:MAG: hypothetical protein ACLTX6_06145 [Lachnospiraceae bacterium]
MENYCLGCADRICQCFATDKYDKNTGKTHARQSLDWHNVEAAASETQFAELNANEPGALYQDVLTTPGAKLYWQLYHRGRGRTAYDSSQTDTMYVLIMSTKLAKQYHVDTQSAVQDVIANVRSNTGKYPGASVATITDDNVKWYRHTGDYDVSENQYLTRFFFVAGETAYDKSGRSDVKAGTVGNHLDHVSFSETVAGSESGYRSSADYKNNTWSAGGQCDGLQSAVKNHCTGSEGEAGSIKSVQP